jgi:hypothetical protein
MKPHPSPLRELCSRSIDWAMVLSFFALQAFIATGGLSHLLR